MKDMFAASQHKMGLLLWAVALAGCTSAGLQVPYGRMAAHEGFVPARTAVLNCQHWMHTSRFRALPLSNISNDDRALLCAKVDAFVLDGFRDQPFMRGFSPNGITKILAAQTPPESNDLVSEMKAHWLHVQGDCVACETAAAFYLRSIKERASWLAWLRSVSTRIRYADAILIPFLMHATEKKIDDHGRTLWQRKAELSFLLVGTEFGYLLWSGGRSALATDLTEYPDWQKVVDRLLVEDIWREYPGRQVTGLDAR